ncbi:MAG: SusD/RagB family nutrient-binding outer membrane lipoprotein [Bacteroidales bacterium]|nr:SusD/RagB family nutrient-binding outer membrane lipoprotein [Bacteroidales bacterium]
MKRISIYAAVAVCVLSVAGCTKNFETFNTNPCAPTEGQMKGDNFLQNSLLFTMMKPLAEGNQNESQMIDQLCGLEFGGSIATVNPFGNAGNYYTYDPRLGWIDSPFTTIMPQIYNSFFKISDLVDKEGLVYNWALLLRVMGTQRLSDIYGPMPYSKVGDGAYSVAYDDMPDLYDNLFKDLDTAISGLKKAVESGDGVVNYLKSADVIYQGDLQKWVRFANTFRLRMAVRISNADPVRAEAEALKSINDEYGLMIDGDAAWSTYNDGMNPLYRAAYAWGGEFMISANVTTFLEGYGDPRLPVYATRATAPGADSLKFVGVRNGVEHTADTKAGHNKLSNLNLGMNDPLLVMSASEGYFLRAECCLKGWIDGDAGAVYSDGIRVSMKERGISDKAAVQEYLAGTGHQADYVCNTYPAENCAHVSNVGVAPSSVPEELLEQILTQKWLASFPNSWEAWADFRRTGYPRHFPVMSNKSATGSTGTVTTERGMRRIPFPISEANTNKENYDEAVRMIGGRDEAGVDLWWALKN